MQTYEIELDKTYANQEFDVVIDEISNSMHVVLNTINDALYMSVYVDNIIVGIPFICLPNRGVIPYPYMQDILGGNFIFETQDNNYPNYENFGTTCKLYFVTK